MKQSTTTVLLVDDVQTNRLILEHFLKHLNFVSEHAENGQQAVDMAKKTDYSAIFMDLHMPVLDGFQATKAIRKHSNNVPIFACSAETNEETLAGLSDLGFTDFIPKPFSNEAVKAMLVQHSIPNRPEKLKNKPSLKSFLKRIPKSVEIIKSSIENQSSTSLIKEVSKINESSKSFGMLIASKLSSDILRAHDKGASYVVFEKALFLVKELEKLSKIC